MPNILFLVICISELYLYVDSVSQTWICCYCLFDFYMYIIFPMQKRKLEMKHTAYLVYLRKKYLVAIFWNLYCSFLGARWNTWNQCVIIWWVRTDWSNYSSKTFIYISCSNIVLYPVLICKLEDHYKCNNCFVFIDILPCSACKICVEEIIILIV